MKNNWKFINLQNLGPIWKLLCCVRMGVDVPSSAALKSSMNRKFGNGRERSVQRSHTYTNGIRYTVNLTIY